MTRTVADQMVETLAAAGVERIYGIVGDSLMASPMRCAAMAAFNGCMSGTRKSPRSQPARMRMSQAVSRSAPEVAVLAICT